MQVEPVVSHILRQTLERGANNPASATRFDGSREIVSLINRTSSSASSQITFGHNPALAPKFEFVARYSAANEAGQDEVVEYQDVFETRPVYEDRAILETSVEGSRDLSGFDSLDEAGIRTGARFNVTVGDGAKAKFKIEDAGTISVRVNGSVAEFSFNAEDGSFVDGLVDALNSVDGLTASVTDDGKLNLETADAARLSLEDVRHSPLAQLGLPGGVIDPEVVGHEQVQVGAEQVKVGEEAVVLDGVTGGAGAEQDFDGYDLVLTGLERTESFDANSLAGSIADDSLLSPRKYAEALFGVVTAAFDESSQLTSAAEARSAYEETLNDAWTSKDDKADSGRERTASPLQIKT